MIAAAFAALAAQFAVAAVDGRRMSPETSPGGADTMRRTTAAGSLKVSVVDGYLPTGCYAELLSG